MTAVDDARASVLARLREHGWNATSFQLLEPGFEHWFHNGGVVGYVDTGGAWVAAGAPVAPGEELGTIAAAFVAEARKRKKRAAFFAVERRLLDAIGLDAVVVGEQPWWNPQEWSATRARHRSLREQLRRARAKGVRVEPLAASELADPAAPARIALERLMARWSSTRAMPLMEFLVALHPFVFAEERRYFAARRGDEWAGVLVAVPVYQRPGWFFEDLLRDPGAPNGTAELLFDAAMESLAKEGCGYVTLGLAPLSGDVRWLRFARRLLAGFYNFDGLRAFKEKLRPAGWDPIYLASPRGTSPLVALYDTLDAFSRGHIFTFAIRSIFRASPFTLRWLGRLLVPWTIALALAPAGRWFPAPWIKGGWVVFDVMVAVALLALARRWRPRLASLVAAAVTLDFILTAFEALTYNLPQRRGAIDVVVVAISLAAPLFAATVLWGGVRRHARERQR